MPTAPAVSRTGLPPQAGAARNAAILAAVDDGRIRPRWHPIVSQANGHTATFYVLADGLRLNGVRISTSAKVLQQIADKLGASLLTPRLLDLIFQQATKILPPCPLWPNDDSTACMDRESDRMDTYVPGLSAEDLVAPVGKNWVLTNELHGAPKAWTGRYKAALYGWAVAPAYESLFVPHGVPLHAGTLPGIRNIQPLATPHDLEYTDYAMLPALVRKDCAVDGRSMDIQDVLQSTLYAPLASHEGALSVLRQPGVPELPAIGPNAAISGEADFGGEIGGGYGEFGPSGFGRPARDPDQGGYGEFSSRGFGGHGPARMGVDTLDAMQAAKTLVADLWDGSGSTADRSPHHRYTGDAGLTGMTEPRYPYSEVVDPSHVDPNAQVHGENVTIVAPGDCPYCRGPSVVRCRCRRSDSTCAQGHRWHYDGNTVHAGHSDHASAWCCSGQAIGRLATAATNCFGRDLEENLSRAKRGLPLIGRIPRNERDSSFGEAFGHKTVSDLIPFLANKQANVDALAKAIIDFTPTWTARDAAGYAAFLADWTKFHLRWVPAAYAANAAIQKSGTIAQGYGSLQSVTSAQPVWDALVSALKPSGPNAPTAPGDFAGLQQRFIQATKAITGTAILPYAATNIQPNPSADFDMSAPLVGMASVPGRYLQGQLDRVFDPGATRAPPMPGAGLFPWWAGPAAGAAGLLGLFVTVKALK